jgi:alpha-L-rhamnosidase
MQPTDLTVERRRDPLGIDVARPRFAWRVGELQHQVAYQLQVLEADVPFWDSGRIESPQSTYVPYSGPALQARHRYTWRVRAWGTHQSESEWSEPAAFEMGLLAPGDWPARWIAHLEPDLASEPEERVRFRPVQLLRRRFALSGTPQRARLYITALGVYEAYFNGTRIGDERLAPGWTDYNKRLQYQTHDATHLLRQGANVLAVRLGAGWYTGSVGAWGRQRYGDLPLLCCQLEIDRQPIVRSDAEWRGANSGTWLDDLQLGERTDLRNESRDWTDAAYDDSAWLPVMLRADPGVRRVAGRDDGIRVVERLPAVSVRRVEERRHIVDVGANIAGVLQLRAQGVAGQRIALRHAEAVDSNSELYVENLRGAEQCDEFVLADSERHTLEPRFTFHGFRYAEVTGLAELRTEDVDAQVLSSATRLIGKFDCSDPLVNKLQRNIVTSLRANFISIPTDCPQRNERLGWTADLQIFAPTALFNADLTNMIDKWLDDLVDSQMPSGAYADVAPMPSGFVGWGNTAWSDAGIIVPWVLYERSGDAGVLARMYESMRRYMAFLEADQTDGLRFGGRYGDWVSLGARTDKTFIGSAYLAYVSELFSRIAGVLGRGDDAEHYADFASNVRRAFQRRFVADDGRLTVQTQTSYAMALGFGLLPDGAQNEAGDRLAELVEGADTHLATGFLGTPLVMPALSETGHHELACRLMRQTSYPSWLFEVEHGATSIWERWNGWTPENGFYSPRMNSFNHYAFGAVGDWLYRYLAGLQPVEPGYRHIELRPRPGAGFSYARASHESMYGVHECAWRLQDATLSVSAVVPPNTSATLVMPEGRRIELAPGRHHFENVSDDRHRAAQVS